MLFLEHVIVQLIGLFARRKDLVRDADLGSATVRTQVLIAHAKTSAVYELLPWYLIDGEWLENTFAIRGV
jgi:hypothetical protein